ncbi:methyl-accepting chemotaxis protein [Methanosarcina sp. KYL-1]|uniref:DUF5788 family protein n=1 Tax=Methanosarcina sp. KYL-1 TaxID=2602068 RepID=UPI002100C2D0|nr:methyl-accepting chemotaxis protein [Methanosarcina sp. KYL-1]
MTEGERRQLLSALHSRLFWVGQYIPHSVELEGKNCPLHEYVWEMIQKEEITEEEKKQIENCIEILSIKEMEDEKELEEKPLTREEARTLYHETAGLLRTIMDLREIEDGTMKENAKRFQEQFLSQRVKDAKLWVEFLKKVKE